MVNPTAGILSGDLLESSIAVDPGAALLITTPSASRVFTMAEGRAESVQRFTVQSHGWLEVTPEPLVPHRGSRYHQTTRVDVAEHGGLFFVDQLMPGRVGHGEAWSWTELVLLLEVTVAGTLVLRERLASSGAELRRMAETMGSGPNACFANAVLLARDAVETPVWRAELAPLHRDGVWVGCSALPRGGWTIKIVAPSPLHMRETLTRARAILGAHFPQLRTPLRKL